MIFLRQLVDGGTDKSYGVHVALMAGLPTQAIDRAFVLLDQTLNGCAPEPSISPSISPFKGEKPLIVSAPVPSKEEIKSRETVTLPDKTKSKKLVQSSLFPIKRYDDSELVILLRSLDLDNMTPVQAFETLKKLKEKLTPQ